MTAKVNLGYAYDTFCYRARCTRVVDGDTADFFVDCGFNSYVCVRVRLLGVDTPELRPRKGTQDEREQEKKAAREAKWFVEDALCPRDSPTDFNYWPIRIMTFKEDSFGRYLADIWYLNDKNEEIHLNQELLDQGLAQPYKKGTP